MQLRPYQIRGDEEAREHIRQGRKRILTVAATGSGKGFWLADLVRRSVGYGRKVIYVVNRKTIVLDMSKRLSSLGVEHGIIMSGHKQTVAPVQVASIDSLHRRDTIPADILIFDESHLSISPIWMKVLARYPNAVVLGTTATPIRLDGKGLGDIFQVIVKWPQMAELMSQGYLVPKWRIFGTPKAPDTSKIHVSHGEFESSELSVIMNRPDITGDIVEHWTRMASNRISVCFAVDKAHARAIQGSFLAAGYPWAYVDCDTPDEERQEIWDGMAAGTIPGVTSVGVVSFGWDLPRCSCAILARPTLSLALYLQMVGRISRAYPGKSEALVLDHSGLTETHGFPDDDRQWSLDGAPKRPKPDDDAPAVRTCKQCWLTFPGALKTCPECGWVVPVKPRKIIVADGELVELTRDQQARKLRLDLRGNKAFLRLVDLKREALHKCYRRGWAVMAFRRQHGWFPRHGWSDAADIEIGIEPGTWPPEEKEERLWA